MDQSKNRNVERVELISTKRNKVYGFSIFTVVVILVLLVGAIRPSLATIVRVTTEIKEKQSTYDQLVEKANTLSALYTEYNEIEQQADDMELVFPSRGDFSLFMGNIEQISKENGFQLTSIAFTRGGELPHTPTQVLKVQKVGLNVVGNRENLIKLLRAIEEMPMYPIVNSVAFGKSTIDTGDTLITVGITIYYIDNPNFFNK